MPAYHRTQILLEPEQHIALADLAAQEERSLSDIFREMTTKFLAERAAENKQVAALAAIERLANFRKKLPERRAKPLPDPTDLLDDLREARMADFERVWRGEE